ncbi:MAG: uracil-DNA glycosylase [Myxococcales bacterium]|nr:uracil-DNA glycosylase [Myxococcales bacterium]
MDAKVAFIGAGPLADEDGSGMPFAGADGALLDRMLTAMGLDRSQVFVTNLVRCRVSETSGPSAEALRSCTPFLRTELATVRPELVVLLGDEASQFLLKQTGVAGARGRWHTLLGIPARVTWGLPLLRHQPARKRDVWQDLQTVMARMNGETESPR